MSRALTPPLAWARFRKDKLSMAASRHALFV
jgi:hypothetical protein